MWKLFYKKLFLFIFNAEKILFHFNRIKTSSIESKVNTSFRSLRKLTYSSSGGSGGSGPSNSTDYYTSVEDSPRSPKIIYSAPPPDARDIDPATTESFKLTNTTDKGGKCSGKYSSDSQYSTPIDLCPKTSNQFVFDAVSPYHESTGMKFSLELYLFFFLVSLCDGCCCKQWKEGISALALFVCACSLYREALLFVIFHFDSSFGRETRRNGTHTHTFDS